MKRRKKQWGSANTCKKSLPDGVNEDSDYLFSSWAEWERANRKRDGGGKMRNKISEGKKEKQSKRQKWDKNKTATKWEREHIEKTKTRQKKRGTVWVPLMSSSSFFNFHSCCFVFFHFSLGPDLSILVFLLWLNLWCNFPPSLLSNFCLPPQKNSITA